LNNSAVTGNSIFEYFSKIFRENSDFIKIRQEWRVLYVKTNIHFVSYLHFFLERKMFQTKVVEDLETNILISITFFSRKSCILWVNVEKYCEEWQATDDDMAHAHCMSDIWGYKRTLRICNTYCFSTTTMVSRTRFSVTLYLHCLSCLTVTYIHSLNV